MGCGGSRITDQTRAKSGKYFYPECAYSFTLKNELCSLAPIDKENIVIGSTGEALTLSIRAKSFQTVFSEHKGRINNIIKLSSGDYASVGQDKTIKIWSLDDKPIKSKCTLSGHKSMIWCIAELNDGRLISGADDKTVIVWDTNAQKQDFVLTTEQSECCSVLQRKNGDVLTGLGNGKVKIWDINTKAMKKEIDITYGVWVLVELSDEKVAIGLGNGVIEIWDMNKYVDCKRLTEGHRQPINCLIEIEPGIIISGSDEPDMIMWNMNDEDSKYLLKGHKNSIASLCKIDERKFASASKDKEVKIWQ